MATKETTPDPEAPPKGKKWAVVSQKLSDYLEGAFETVVLTRRTHFENNPTKRPSKSDVDHIISSYANNNAVVAGACNLVPGPWGALAVLPEITLVVRNQIQMIYDLGVAHGKEAHLTPNTLLATFSTVMSGGAISLVTVEGGKLLVSRASVRIIQKIVKWLGVKILRRVLKGLIARWVPVIGAAAMALWARQSTVEIGRKAAALLAKEIVEA